MSNSPNNFDLNSYKGRMNNTYFHMNLQKKDFDDINKNRQESLTRKLVHLEMARDKNKTRMMNLNKKLLEQEKEIDEIKLELQLIRINNETETVHLD